MPEIQEEPIQRESETKATPPPPPPPPPTTDPSTPKSDTVASPAEAEKEAKAEAEDQSEAKTQTKPKPKTRPKPKPKPESKQTDLPPRPKRKRGPTKPRAKKAAKQPASEPRVALEATEEEPKPAAAPTPPSPASPAPPPEKAITFFPVLPAESNPIDEVILQRLAECWDEESPRWDLSMREDFIANIPRARVTRTTVQFTNHNLVKHVRASAVQPSWGQWMVLRVMFGPGICSRQKWFKGFAEAFPLAKEPAYDGVVPVNAVDVLDGKAMMPLQRKRKAAVWQLQRQRTRITKPKEATTASAPAAAAVKKEAGDEEGDGGSSSGVQVKEEQDEDEDVPDAVEKRWKRARVAVKGASKMTPGMAIRQLEQRYKEQDAQIRVLRESNGKIRRAVDGYLEMLRLLDGETIKFEVADEPVSGDELA